MKKDLSDSTDRFDLISTKGVYPISKVDAQIIEKLTKILATIDVESNIIGAIRCWKSLPDEDILGLLETIEMELEENIDDILKATRDFIELPGPLILPVGTLF